MPGGQFPVFDAVILAGGLAARMDGADKPALLVGGRPMLVSVASAAAAAGAGRIIVVGPERDGAIGAALTAIGAGRPHGLRIVCEEPPAAGPVAALRRGLAEVTASWLMLLAADLPFLTDPWLTRLLAVADKPGQSGALLADDAGRLQWLAGCWRADRLRDALRDYSGPSLGGLLGPLDPAVISPASGPDAAWRGSPGPPPWLDCDDPSELTAARTAYQDGAP